MQTTEQRAADEFYGPLTQDLDVEVRYLGSKGRGLFARKDFEEGDIIVEEKPLVSSQLPINERYTRACSYCQRWLGLQLASEYVQARPEYADLKELIETGRLKTIAGFNCPDCTEPFCSDECFQKGKQFYHDYLCPVKNPNAAPLHQFIQQNPSNFLRLLSRLFALEWSSASPSSVRARCSSFQSVEIPYKDNPAISNNLQELYKLVITIRQQSGTETNFAEDFHSFVTRLGQVQQNTQSFEPKSIFAGDPLFGAAASGLFTLQSTINHSCDPNIFYETKDDNTLIIAALKPIPAGAELEATYIDNDNDFETRQTLLHKFGFTCRCRRCTAEAPKV